jgi:thiol-disulfide isomerase/thioredoxin
MSRALMQWCLALISAACVVGVLSWHVRDARPLAESHLVRDPEFAAQLLSGPAPDIEVVAKDGSKIRLSDMRGKVVFINFWATWCPPCRAEMPDLEKLAETMKFSPFEVFAVSSDQSFEQIDAFFGGRKTRMRIGLDPEQKWAEVYGTERLPETYVVDRDGNLRLRFVNVRPWTDSRIHRYLEWLANDG